MSLAHDSRGACRDEILATPANVADDHPPLPPSQSSTQWSIWQSALKNWLCRRISTRSMHMDKLIDLSFAESDVPLVLLLSLSSIAISPAGSLDLPQTFDKSTAVYANKIRGSASTRGALLWSSVLSNECRIRSHWVESSRIGSN